MGVQILNKDVSLISSIANIAKARISSVFGIGGWSTPSGPGTQGPNLPSTGVDRGGGDVGWDNPQYITSDDGQDAFSDLTGFVAATNYISAENFGFSIPTSATIDGIEVKFQIFGSNLNGVIGEIKLWKGNFPTAGSEIGTLTPGETVPDTGTTLTYGGPTNKWGGSQTPSDINSTDFLVLLRIDKGNLKGGFDVSIDYFTVKIYYTT